MASQEKVMSGLSGQVAAGGAQIYDREIPANLTADSLSTVPPKSRQEGNFRRILSRVINEVLDDEEKCLAYIRIKPLTFATLLQKRSLHTTVILCSPHIEKKILRPKSG
ncbi:hypothetical protein PoB_001195000 [Plakobranchus ocellatus]|uniref:Uncharacterized protein n=1 Tax=Plakobranchus ocellatus TaxID=259542 RepID=A0AAV3YQN4_9GAST|nr:hypothetical protein PoB_001195000 [Plakobranchus ocellatus]